MKRLRIYELKVSLDTETDATLRIAGNLTRDNADTLFDFLAIAKSVMDRWPLEGNEAGTEK